MPYNTEIGTNFWFDFDNQTLWQRTADVTRGIQEAYFDQGLSPDTFADAFIASWWHEAHPTPFLERVSRGRDGIFLLADIQLQIVRGHLVDPDDVRHAFEDFGQGVLFDPRPPRPPTRHIHMMDGQPNNWVGYRRWLTFVRAAELLGHQSTAELAHFKRCAALAWAVQTEADPDQASAANPGLPTARLDLLGTTWMATNDAMLDWAVATHRFRAPSVQELRSGGRFAAVRAILEAATGDGQPDHGGLERFWNLPLSQFVGLSVHGHPLIAAPGPDRGSRSALVLVLRGALPGMPRMPLGRPPLSDDQIQFISRWIDAGCPEI